MYLKGVRTPNDDSASWKIDSGRQGRRGHQDPENPVLERALHDVALVERKTWKFHGANLGQW
jgi:hypothetical protein